MTSLGAPAEVQKTTFSDDCPQLRPAFRCAEYFARKYAGRNGKGDLSSREGSASILPIDAGRRSGGVGKPIDRNVVQHLIHRKRVFRQAFVVRPRLEFLVDPKRLTSWRIRKAIADGLRARGLLSKISISFPEKELRALDLSLFLEAELLGDLLRKYKLPTQVNSDQTGWLDLSQRSGCSGSPVAALRYAARPLQFDESSAGP